MKQKTLITAAIALMLGGLWWQFKGSTNATANNEPASPATVTTEPTRTTTTDQPTSATDEETETTDEETYFDQQDPLNPQAAPERTDGTVNVDSLATDEELNQCTPIQNGYGIVMKNWGKIRLPYADNWPKNEPGTPVDCSPDSDFGAAVVAAHTLYLESFSPELIPEIAEDTPGRQLRIENHTEGYDTNDLVTSCSAIGWDRPQAGLSVWYIYHQCEGDTLDVTPVRMHRVGDEWLMMYDISGQVRVDEAPPETAYFPFEGGD